MRHGLHQLLVTALCIFFIACDDPKAIFDQNVPIKNHNWTYVNKFKAEVKIEDEQAAYNIFLNLRHTADYKYSNIFVLIRQSGPGQAMVTRRHEFKLANPDGEWLGKGSGNLFNYQLPIKTNYKFPSKGIYHFVIEQNMRDNPLKEINDVGMRVEKVE